MREIIRVGRIIFNLTSTKRKGGDEKYPAVHKKENKGLLIFVGNRYSRYPRRGVGGMTGEFQGKNAVAYRPKIMWIEVMQNIRVTVCWRIHLSEKP